MPYSNWHNKAAVAWAAVLLLAAIALASMWWQGKLHIQSDIFRLLPQQQQQAEVSAAKAHMNQWLNRQLFVMVSAPSEAELQRSSAAIAQRFAASPLWQAPQATIDTQALGKTLFAHKAGLLSADDVALLKQQQYDALSDAALLQLASPAMPISDALLEQDPLLLFPRYVLGLQATSDSDIQLQDGYPSRELNGRYYRLLSVPLPQSPFNIDYQQQTAPWLAQLQQDYPSDSAQTAVHMTGTLLYASAGTDSARSEVSTIGVGSTLGIILLVWFGFKSFRPLFTEFAAVSSGCMMAMLVTHTLFGEVHLMTTVFGASLIGASVDFSFYYLFMQTHQRERSGWQVMHSMLPDLFIGLLTTLAAYVCLLLTPFPGLRQIAVFSMTGLSAAWLTSMLMLPYLKALDTRRAQHHLHFLARGREHFLAHRSWRIAVVVISVLFAALLLPRLHSNDDVHSLQAANAHWQQQEQQIRTVFGQQHSTQFFVVSGTDEAATAANESALLTRLQALQTDGHIGQIQALGLALPSIAVQEQQRQLLQNIPTEVLTRYAEQVGIPTDKVLAWQQNLPKQALLSPQDLQQHPAYLLRVNDHTRLVLVQNIRDSAAMSALAHSMPHTFWVQPAQDLSQLFQTYRLESTGRLLWGLAALALLLACVYGWRSVFGLIAPVSLALLSTFALQAAFGVEVNIFSIMAAFLVLGIGVDYAIFYRHTAKRTPVVSYALFLCMLASILGFGLLALSHTQAIRVFGLTVLLGVVFSYFYANILTLPAATADAKDEPHE
ncbi:hypothetical protein LVJ82_03310 [Vitreoscilla massiliensis]|uniref:Uncharacterized protein n=1 Tax=Vitreoscilla massiliensis TaxID=1689272 RepID=A0ABY4E2P2_9NEIS|nr:hypothetical protein [Vitreoscilla massiliensis]UOO90031.1 hypothetical protein LVJ82_03310 [Vitreoscilla massiliensis]